MEPAQLPAAHIEAHVGKGPECQIIAKQLYVRQIKLKHVFDELQRRIRIPIKTNIHTHIDSRKKGF